MVGAGVVGLAIARELQSRGARVVVHERSGIGAGASGVQPGGVRQQWGTRVACRLARESVGFWREVNQHLHPRVPLQLRASGYLFLGYSETLWHVSNVFEMVTTPATFFYRRPFSGHKPQVQPAARPAPVRWRNRCAPPHRATAKPNEIAYMAGIEMFSRVTDDVA